MAMDAGRLDQRITLLQPSESQGALGSADPIYDAAAGVVVWASVVWVRGAEGMARGVRVVADADYLITIRRRSDVTPRTRIVWGAIAFDVLAAGSPDPRGFETVIQVRQRDV